MAYKVGVDIGGTFTDLFAYDTESKKSICMSMPSTPEDFAQGVLDVIENAGIEHRDIELIAHGTTVATNAVIERSYAKVAFITTKGFRDLIEIGRYHRQALYDPYLKKPEPLVKRRYRYEVTERIDKNGETIVPLNEDELRAIAKQLKTEGIETVAIGFMNSYANNRNEILAKEIIKRELPGVYVITSAETIPSIGALGRFSTAIINAALYPLFNNYIENLEKKLAAKGFKGKLLLVQSNGGAMTSELIRNKPETLLLSGPAGGVVGAVRLSQFADAKNIITFDMGGTSCDISVVTEGKPAITSESEIDWDMPVPLPVIEIKTIGAGGGSIAWIDTGGAIKVGPKSAGAKPGPVCYGNGGKEPTVTDANLILGYLDPDNFLGGKMSMDVDSAREHIKNLGERLGLNWIEAAEGILEIVNENMANAVREMTIAKGIDPRDYALTAFGGAGSLHAITIADKVGIPMVIVPPEPGNLCAFGDICLDIKQDCECFFYSQMNSVDLAELNKKFNELDGKGINILKSQDIKYSGIEINHTVSMRYVGQSYEINVPCPYTVVSRNNAAELKLAFHRLHEQIYMVCDLNSEIEITKLRTTVTGLITEEMSISGEQSRESCLNEAKIGTRKMYFKGKLVETPIYNRAVMGYGETINGPAAIQEIKATTIIPPGKKCWVDERGNLLVKII